MKIFKSHNEIKGTSYRYNRDRKEDYGQSQANTLNG